MSDHEIEDLLNAARWPLSVTEVARRALEDPEVLQTVVSLCAQGHWPALVTSQKLEERHSGAVMTARLQALAQGLGDYRLVRLLARLVDQAPVRAALTDTMASTGGATFMECAAVLVRADEAAVITAVREALTSAPEGLGSAQRAVAVMKTGQEELRDVLRNWVQHNAHDERMPAFAAALGRSSEQEAPKALLQSAKAAKVQEEFHGFYTGVAEMDHIREQPAASSALRVYTCKSLGKHVVGLMQAGDRQTALWPQDLDAEPHPASWEYLILRLWPVLDAASATEWCEAVLLEHLHGPYPEDHRLLLGWLGRALFQREMGAAHRILQAILSVNVFEAPTQARLKSAHRRTLLWSGQKALSEGQIADAEKVARALLADQPAGEALLFDVQVQVRASGPEAGIAAADAHLPHLVNDPIHSAHLLDEKAQALLSLKRPTDALTCLQQAAQLDQGDPKVLTHLAQAHHALGHAEAQQWAALALAAGADPERLKGIVSRQ